MSKGPSRKPDQNDGGKGSDGPRRVGIEEVAQAAGVSTTAVSLIMNGKGRLSDATREKVFAVAEELGYQPSAAAVALATGRSRVLALAFSRAWDVPYPLTEIDYFDRAIRAATAQALKHDYALIIGPPDIQAKVLSRTPVDGLIILDPVLDEPLIRRHSGHPPLITIGRAQSMQQVAGYVDNDHRDGTRTAVQHLMDCGGKQPALLAADLRDSFTRDCIEGYESWCREHDHEPLTYVAIPRDVDAVFESMDAIAAGTESGPLAVYANDDLLARQAVLWAEDQDLNIPDDFLLVAGSDRTDFRDVGVELTTLEIKPEDLASAAVDLLVDILGPDEPSERGRILPTLLRPRQSTTGVLEVS